MAGVHRRQGHVGPYKGSPKDFVFVFGLGVSWRHQARKCHNPIYVYLGWSSLHASLSCACSHFLDKKS